MALFFAICYLIAVVLFLVGTIGTWERINLISLGLAFFAVPFLIQAFQGV